MVFYYHLHLLSFNILSGFIAFNLDKVNVICIDYGPLATADNYFQAALNAVNVGQFAGENLGVKILLDGLGQSPDQIHMIGNFNETKIKQNILYKTAQVTA